MAAVRKSLVVPGSHPQSQANVYSWNAHFLRRRCSAQTVFVALALSVAGLASLNASAQVNVTTWHNDIGRTGQNLNETILNTSNVNSTTFGKLFSQPVDGQVYAQPLYLSGITVNGATHNVIFIATEHDSVYAFDADSNGGSSASALWHASMLATMHGAAAGATTVPSADVGSDINPEVGITGTPVIDPTTGTIYLVSKSLENGSAIQRLHALDVTTGLEKFGGPVVVTATINGTGNGSVNGKLTFDQLWDNQRPGLLLLNGIVYIGFAAHGDNGPWHGWILGYNAATLKQTGAYNASPNGTGSGLWMSGAGLAADQLDPVNKPFGRMFVATGNGDYNASKPYTNAMDYGDTHLNLDLTNGNPTVTDEFTTNQQASLNSEDGDVGSGGLMVVPTQTGTYSHLAVQAGKGGTLYLLNRDNLGGYNTTTDQALQEQAYAVGNVGVWSSPAYWNGNVYMWGRFDYLKSFTLSNGKLSTAPTKSANQYGFPGATPSISANGASEGIVWTIDSETYASNTSAILEAHDASNVATLLYSSSKNTARDHAGVPVKFTVPTIANGKVYVGTQTEVDIYGLLAGTTQAASPVFSPGTESFSGSVSVTITDSTASSTIYYTTDGSTPTTSSAVYSGPITVTSTETISAIASASGKLQSAVTKATYTAISQTAAPVFSVAAGTYAAAQTVAITDSSSGAKIYYTTNGTTPTTSSTLYSAPITVSATATIEAIAVATGLTTSPVASATYTIQGGPNGINFPQGFAASTGLVYLNGSAQLNDTRLQLTNGLIAEAGSAWYMTPVNIQNFTTDFTFQLSNPNANGITFAIQNTGSYNALGGNGYQLGYAPIKKSAAVKFDLYNAAGEGPDSTGLYLNGANPTVPAINLTGSGINLHSDDTMDIHLVYNGTTLTMTITDMVTSAVYTTSWTVNLPSTIGSNTAYVGFTGSTGGQTASQKILTWTFTSGTATTTPTAATPTFSVAAGTYSAAQTVTIADATTGANIYYTTNGTAPTTSSTLYSSAITVSATETIQAIAVASGYNNSAVASAAYTISAAPTAATPTFSVAAGTYSAAQSVTLADTTTGAKIYYTTNGTTPTTASTLYSSAITVSASETIQAIAVASGYNNSAVASAAYTISTTPPVINYPSAFTAAKLNLYGTSIVNGALVLTNGSSGESNIAWYTTPVNVQKFTTDFTFTETSASADGFTFTLQNAAAGVWAIGGNAYELGYGGIPNSLAVKFDLYNNSGEGTDSTGFFTAGAIPTVPALDMTSSGVNLHAGHSLHAHLTYDGTTLTLTLTDLTTNAVFTASKAINIPTTVGANTAYAGFTAGTGALSATQTVTSWTYTVN